MYRGLYFPQLLLLNKLRKSNSKQKIKDHLGFICADAANKHINQHRSSHAGGKKGLAETLLMTEGGDLDKKKEKKKSS